MTDQGQRDAEGVDIAFFRWPRAWRQFGRGKVGRDGMKLLGMCCRATKINNLELAVLVGGK